MTKEEIAKELYKENPIATLVKIQNGSAYYTGKIRAAFQFDETVTFIVPVTDMGDTPFYSEMEAKFLRRWIVCG